MLKVMGHVMHVEFGRCDIYLIWVHTLWALWCKTWSNVYEGKQNCNYCDGRQRRGCLSLFLSENDNLFIEVNKIYYTFIKICLKNFVTHSRFES